MKCQSVRRDISSSEKKRKQRERERVSKVGGRMIQKRTSVTVRITTRMILSKKKKKKKKKKEWLPSHHVSTLSLFLFSSLSLLSISNLFFLLNFGEGKNQGWVR